MDSRGILLTGALGTRKLDLITLLRFHLLLLHREPAIAKIEVAAGFLSQFMANWDLQTLLAMVDCYWCILLHEEDQDCSRSSSSFATQGVLVMPTWILRIATAADLYIKSSPSTIERSSTCHCSRFFLRRAEVVRTLALQYWRPRRSSEEVARKALSSVVYLQNQSQ